MKPPSLPRGRGSRLNPGDRFADWQRAAFDDGWADDVADEPDHGPATTLLLDKARSVIVRNASPDVPFAQSINPYKGCEHGCAYCFARPGHAYLGLSPGLDFETKIAWKPDAPAVLRRELAAPGYRCQPIALGINTDGWQPVERRLGLTRQLLAINAINARWPLGRLYLGADRHSCEAAVSLLVGAEPLASEWLYLALDGLGDMCRLIRAGALDSGTPEHALDALLAQQRLRLAEAPGGLTLLDVETALTQLGLHYRIADAGETLLLALHESNHPELGIELSKRDRRYLNLIAHHPTAGPLPDVDTLMWQLHQANRRILLGSCIFDPERSLLYHRSTLPLAWAPIDAARVGWLIDHAAAALDLLAPGMGD